MIRVPVTSRAVGAMLLVTVFVLSEAVVTVSYIVVGRAEEATPPMLTTE